jgi:hypothetical protein
VSGENLNSERPYDKAGEARFYAGQRDLFSQLFKKSVTPAIRCLMAAMGNQKSIAKSQGRFKIISSDKIALRVVKVTFENANAPDQTRRHGSITDETPQSSVMEG